MFSQAPARCARAMRPHGPAHEAVRSGISIEKRDTVGSAENIYLDHMSVRTRIRTKRWFRFRAVRTPRSHTACSPTRFHRKLHDHGPLICPRDQHQGDCGRTTLWRNIISSHRWRNPALKSVGGGVQNERVHDVINTLISNPGQFGIMVVDDHPDANNVGTCANVAANIMERGPKSTGPIALINQSNETAAANMWHAPVVDG